MSSTEYLLSNSCGSEKSISHIPPRRSVNPTSSADTHMTDLIAWAGEFCNDKE